MHIYKVKDSEFKSPSDYKMLIFWALTYLPPHLKKSKDQS